MRIKAKGFTLIEVLVVLFILSIAASFVVLSLVGFDAKRQARATAERLRDSLILAHKEAILRPTTIRFTLTEQGYRFARKINDTWQIEQATQLLKPHSIANKLVIHSNLPSRGLLFTPEGLTRTFTLTIGTQETPESFTLSNQSGQIQLEKPESAHE